MTSGHIQTVTGPIAPEALGPTLMHEHLLCNIVPPAARDGFTPVPLTMENAFDLNYGRVKGGKFPMQDIDVSTQEVRWMMQDGGAAIVELTIGGLVPDPEGLKRIAEDTGCQIVMGCGHYVEEYQDPANHDRDIDSFAEEIVAQVTTGAWGTDIRAGIIGEIGCQTPWTPLERKVMKGAVIAQQATGASVNVHPGREQDQPMEVAQFFIDSDEGDVTRLVLSHIDRTIFDDDRLCALADTGCVLEWDLFGQENTFYPLNDIDMPNDGKRLRDIRMLIDRGHLDQIVISHDICYSNRLQTYGGHGFGHIFRNVVPLMKERGWTQAEIDAVLIHNPRRVLTIQ
ncbi:aryldialkylphosphatase [Primorskyibacter flagellatus]|uniref:Aryldialkylphosphatase n=1 Tax=Primorskyibacter flagellatus TaxID=1387277 RepID=A0A917EIZ6_9RHOB|nr:aryldialkylphosphatase [Primorskyibacter flagellatus]GGE46925.1 aryldialkylphosphatase [Primorskyibacter flagellatus]